MEPTCRSGMKLGVYWYHAPVLAADGRKVGEALEERSRLFRRRTDWAEYFG